MKNREADYNDLTVLFDSVSEVYSMEWLTQPCMPFETKVGLKRSMMLEIVGGALFIALLSQAVIPLYPVPITLQTFGIYLLAKGQGGEKAASSLLCYLVFATLGLPVLATPLVTHQDPSIFWFFALPAGYLTGFPIAAYVVGKGVFAKKSRSFLPLIADLCLGSGVILAFGVFHLNRFVSFPESLALGLIPFLPIEGIKIACAASIISGYRMLGKSIRKRLSLFK